MFQWISENSDSISAIANVSMLFVWIAYLQVFLRSYRRQVRPKIVINRAAGTALEAACFVSNMSSESIYVESVVVTLVCGDYRARRAVTDLDILDGEDLPSDPRKQTFQGPLGPGEYTAIGTFSRLLDRMGVDKDEAFDRLKQSAHPLSLEVVVVADYSSDDLLIGARRRFSAECKDGEWVLTSETTETEQISSRRERRRIKEWIASEGGAGRDPGSTPYGRRPG